MVEDLIPENPIDCESVGDIKIGDVVTSICNNMQYKNFGIVCKITERTGISKNRMHVVKINYGYAMRDFDSRNLIKIENDLAKEKFAEILKVYEERKNKITSNKLYFTEEDKKLHNEVMQKLGI